MSEPSPNPIDPRVDLAQHRTRQAGYRTKLALDRTTLAWIRTTLTIASFGFGTVAFFRTLREHNQNAESVRLHEGAIHFGLALIIVGMGATVLAAVSHWLALRKLRRGETPALSQWPLSITLAMFLALLCLAGLWILFQQ